MKKSPNFRRFETTQESVVLGGKNAEQNEKLVKRFTGKNNVIMHTAKPGSPFCVILGKPKKGDLKETAIFCARYSQTWKKPKIKKDVEMHVFTGKDVYKDKDMKTGTFGVKRRRKMIVKKEDLKK